MKHLSFSQKNGQSLVEVLLAIGLMALIIPALYVGFIAARQGKPQQQQRLQAVTILHQVNDELRSIRESGWSNFAQDGTFYPILSGNAFTLTSGSYTDSNGFTQQAVISDVYRATSSGQIVNDASLGYLDPSTKQVVTTVSWGVPFSSNVSTTTYITRQTNLSYTQTTTADFNAGTNSNTNVVATTGTQVSNDGQVQLAVAGGGGGGDWCKPSLSITPLDLPGQGITTAIWANTQTSNDYAYTTTGGNSSGHSMDAVSITHANPPVATSPGYYSNFKTYGLFVDSTNQYVYLTSDHPGLTVDIVQVSSQPYTQVGTFSESHGGAGSSVFVGYNSNYGNTVGYVTAGNIFATFDLSSKTGSRSELGFASLAGTGKKTIVVGNYAYVAVGASGEQLDIFDISDVRHPTKVSHIDVHNGQPATDLYVNADGSRVYLVTKQASPQTNDFFIINTSTKSSTLPTPLGSYNTGAMSPLGVAVVSYQGNSYGVAIIVGNGGEQYKVLDISNEASPTRCGGITSPNGASSINAISSIIRANNDAYSYILTNNPTGEFQMIQGGSGVWGGSQYDPAGFFTSSAFDTQTQGLSQSVFNRFSATINQPSNTLVEVQVAAAAAVNNSCSGANYSFVGPDGTSGTYFTANNNIISGIIPIGTVNNYINPNRCFKYKTVFASSDQSKTPVLYDFTANYSP